MTNLSQSNLIPKSYVKSITKTGFSKAYQGSSRNQWVCFNNNHAYSHGWSLL